jgi:VWFA-related protein
MQSFVVKRARLLASLAASLCLLAPLRAQDAPPPPPASQEPEEVVRVSSELVQTDVMVFNKQGNFVDDLKSEEFELKVDGKPQPIAFFERVEAGAINEDAQLAAARGGRTRAESRPPGAPIPLDRGRTVIFFADDLHLSPESALRARQALLRFVDEELGQNDEAAVASASGQVGFLQQFTDDRAVLRAAVGRIQARPYNLRDGQTPRMTETHALAIGRHDFSVTGYFVDAMLRENPLMSREMAENAVRGRARDIMSQSRQISNNTLYSLEALVRYSAPLPGRKLLFFISDGFIVDTEEDSTRDLLRRITDAAARAGVVIYSMDPAGLRTGAAGAAAEVTFDPTGRLTSAEGGEVRNMQEPLHTLAADTGGRALINTNAMGPAVEGALKETSRYYLLAWRPEGNGERGAAKFRRIEVSVRGRRDLNVMVRRGFYVGDAPPGPEARDGGKRRKGDEGKAQAQVNPESAADRELRSALGAPRPLSALPASLSVGFVDMPEHGGVATVSVGLEPEASDLLGAAPDGSARLDVAGIIYNDRGQFITGFKQDVSVGPREAGADPRELILQSQQVKLAPGLYQVRVAVRDRLTRRAGSAIEWIEIPNFKQGQFALSSIFLAERTSGEATDKLKPEQLSEGVLLNVGRRFSRSSWMRFVTFVYNASKGAARPDVALQVQVFRDDQPVMTAPLARINSDTTSDAARLPYAAEIPLNTFPVGRYVLQLTAIDRAAKITAKRRIDFTVE